MRDAGRGRSARPTALLAAAVIVAASGAAAQGLPGADPSGRALRLNELLPELPPARSDAPGLVLPTLPERATRGPLSGGPRFILKGVRIDGATALGGPALHAAAEPYVGKPVGAGELEEIRQALTRLYVEAGYVNSGALLPDQDITDGVVAFTIVEGRLTDVRVEGAERLDPDFLAARLRAGAGDPLNLNALKRRLEVVLDEPEVSRLNLNVAPGVRPGEATLHAQVSESDRSPVSLAVEASDAQSPDVGPYRGELAGSVRNLTGRGDSTMVRLGRTQGVTDARVTSALPVSPYDTVLTVDARWNQALVTEPRMRVLDIRSRARVFELGVTQPLYQSGTQRFAVGAAFAREQTRTTLLGEPFSFSSGVNNGQTDLTVLRLSQDYLVRDPDQVFNVRSTVSWGIDAFNATMTGQKPDGRFTKWLGQAQYIRRVGGGQLILRSNLQLAGNPLFSVEQFAVGGIDTVRGYREGLLVRDNAATATAELRLPVLDGSLPGPGGAPMTSVVQLAPFADWGRAWNRNRPSPTPTTLASVGLGVLWTLADRIDARVYYGHALRRVSLPDRTIQDRGIHFRVGGQLY